MVLSGGYTQYPGDGVIVYTPEEYEWARRRPAHQRTPIPKVGDEVRYRHRENWAPVKAAVIRVQNAEDFTDPNLWYWQTDGYGRPRLEEGQRILAQAHDPWPNVWLRLEELVGDLRPGQVLETREARLRGSPGWLPLDWETRPVPQPQILILRRPAE